MTTGWKLERGQRDALRSLPAALWRSVGRPRHLAFEPAGWRDGKLTRSRRWRPDRRPCRRWP